MSPLGFDVHAIFGKAGTGIIRRCLERDVDAPAEVAIDRPAVAFEIGDHLDGAVMLELPTHAGRPEHVCEVIDAAGRKAEPVARYLEAAGIGDRRHLDAGLGAVDEAVEHFGVHAAGVFGFIVGDAEMLPDRLRGRAMHRRQIARPLAGADHGKARRPGPVHHLTNQGRLVAIGEAVDKACFRRTLGKKRPDQNIRLDIDHDQMTAMLDGGKGMARAGSGITGSLDQHIQAVGSDQSHAVIGEMGLAACQG